MDQVVENVVVDWESYIGELDRVVFGILGYDMLLKLEILCKWVDFLCVVQVCRQGVQGFLLQVCCCDDGSNVVCVGFICLKKIGNVVMCNCVKWWLCVLVYDILLGLVVMGWDYVLVGCFGVMVECDFIDLKCDFEQVLFCIYVLCK